MVSRINAWVDKLFRIFLTSPKKITFKRLMASLEATKSKLIFFKNINQKMHFFNFTEHFASKYVHKLEKFFEGKNVQRWTCW